LFFLSFVTLRLNFSPRFYFCFHSTLLFI
jgi:hypothetical protein